MDQSESLMQLSNLLHSQTENELEHINSIASSQPGASEFFQSLASIHLKHLIRLDPKTQENAHNLQAWIKVLLNSPLYEVRLTVLEILVSVTGKDGRNTQRSPTKIDQNVEEEQLKKNILTDDVVRQLVEMVKGKEHHAECLVQVSHNVLVLKKPVMGTLCHTIRLNFGASTVLGFRVLITATKNCIRCAKYLMCMIRV